MNISDLDTIPFKLRNHKVALLLTVLLSVACIILLTFAFGVLGGKGAGGSRVPSIIMAVCSMMLLAVAPLSIDKTSEAFYDRRDASNEETLRTYAAATHGLQLKVSMDDEHDSLRETGRIFAKATDPTTRAQYAFDSLEDGTIVLLQNGTPAPAKN